MRPFDKLRANGVGRASGASNADDFRSRSPEDEIIYFVLPDRFDNADPANDRASRLLTVRGTGRRMGGRRPERRCTSQQVRHRTDPTSDARILCSGKRRARRHACENFFPSILMQCTIRRSTLCSPHE